MKKFSAFDSKTSCIPLKNPERVRGGKEAGGIEGQPGARDGYRLSRKREEYGDKDGKEEGRKKQKEKTGDRF